ncbi:MAG TPA: FTR1 family protein [Terriglobia bacterium]|jgi:high-affinity iron transporter
MLQAFIVVFREGFESFLIVGVILAYLRRIGQHRLVPAMYWGIAASVLASTGLGYMLSRGVNESLWEGILGLVTIVLVGSLVVHMWKAGAHMKRDMESKLSEISQRSSRWAFAGVFFFTLVMITKEGMETVLMLFQIQGSRSLATGVFLGVVGATALAWSWVRFGHLINIKRFFQVTAIFLMLFMVQIGIYSFHEFSEARVLPNSEALHDATEPFSSDGIYGRWFSVVAIGACAVWLAGAKVNDSIKVKI